MNICLFSPEELEKPLDIHDVRGEHILKILHKKEGDSFSAGVIGGQAGQASITRIDICRKTSADGRKQFDAGTISYTFSPETDGKPLYPLIMVIGFPRPIQLKRLLRDMAGLGVAEIHLTGTELGEKSYLKSDLATSDAGYQMLLEGTQQAAGTHIPKLFRHETLKECLSFIEQSAAGKGHGAVNRMALDNVQAEGNLAACLQERKESVVNGLTVAAIGSERGWTSSERELLHNSGYALLRMGSRVLRTETAATVAASLILGAMDVLD